MDMLLEVRNLSVEFHTPEGLALAVEGVSFHLAKGETLAIVGESGCGKTVTCLSILGLVPSPPGRVKAEGILFEGRDLFGVDREALREVRGKEISMIFQDPMSSLNPLLPIGRQVAEPLMTHRGLTRVQAYQDAAAWLEHVKIPAARHRLDHFPHELSGGMRQRVMIAMAMVCRPKLLIADEPTTALDVTTQAQILSVMEGLKTELAMSMLLITHDLGVVAQMAHRVVVMYAGEVVEETGVIDLFERPLHPYTEGLLKSVRHLETRIPGRTSRLMEIPGTVPPLTERIPGCKFADRCPHVLPICRKEHPDLLTAGEAHMVRCWRRDGAS